MPRAGFFLAILTALLFGIRYIVRRSVESCGPVRFRGRRPTPAQVAPGRAAASARPVGRASDFILEDLKQNGFKRHCQAGCAGLSPWLSVPEWSFKPASPAATKEEVRCDSS